MKCVVAEDEAILRDDLLDLLAEAWPELEVVAACEDGGCALEAIIEHKPEVAFLDIRMPGLTGLEVAAEAADESPATQIVFVTAYNQYAIDAFERGAVDYLLKPITRERLAATMRRVKTRQVSGGVDPAALASIVEQLRTTLRRLNITAIPHGARTHSVDSALERVPSSLFPIRSKAHLYSLTRRLGHTRNAR